MLDKNEIEKAIVQSIKDNAERIFDRSQDTIGCFVPVESGDLKSSGFKNDTNTGAVIGYNAPHAHDIEFGHEDRPITETSRIYVPSYRKSNGTVVKGHYKNINGKIITFQPKISKFEKGESITRTIKVDKARDGQAFLSRAVKRELDNFIDDMASNLSKAKLGGKVKVTFIKH